MTDYILVKSIHLVSILLMVACLFGELVLLRKEMTRSQIGRISRLDGLYGVAALFTVAAGLTLWFWVGKPASYYDNPVLYVKVAIVILVGLISIIPTVYFLKNRKGREDEIVVIPNRIRGLVVLQLFLLAVVPPLAVMMAFGLRF